MSKTKHRNPLELRKIPTQSRSAETVNAVLEAAARILEESGFEGYTTNAVAERAGVSIGSLYQYFPGKDALTVALIERETSVLLEEIAAAQLAQSCVAGLEQMIAAAVAHQMRRPALARLLDFEERRLPIDARNGRVADQIHVALLALFGRNDAPVSEHAETAAYDVIAIVKGMVDAAGERAETDARQLELRVRRAVFGYLQA
ncbi:TetR/AcrR family transcriptional regulator [Paraherbaspirillum soli]|uniref:TetR/AcrR family transcriptional regulator n=1 Tax=Paraherbaspirillum soli TaxID=631222 RepID=A0ABW0MFD1_9BURK